MTALMRVEISISNSPSSSVGGVCIVLSPFDSSMNSPFPSSNNNVQEGGRFLSDLVAQIGGQGIQGGIPFLKLRNPPFRVVGIGPQKHAPRKRRAQRFGRTA